MTMTTARQGHTRARGFTLIELMIVLVIGLVISLVLMNVLTFFEGSRRTATSVNDIDNAGTSVVQRLEFAIRGAGAGFTQTVAQSYGCKVQAARKVNGTYTNVLPITGTLPAAFSNVLGATGINGPIRLAPVVILQGNTPASELANNTSTSDVLLLMSGAASGSNPNAGASGPGNGGATGMPSALTAAPDAAGRFLTLQNSAAFASNDVVLLTDDTTSTGRANCMLAEVAATGFTSPGTTLPLGGSFYSTANFSVNGLSVDALPVPIGNVNSDAATPNPLANDNLPQFQLIGVGNSVSPMLYTYDLLSPLATEPQPLGDSVLEIHALYGLDTNGDNIVDTWQQPNGNFAAAALLNGSEAAAANLEQIKAIRLGVILRSPLIEKTTVPPATTGPVLLFANLPCPPGSAACTTATTTTVNGAGAIPLPRVLNAGLTPSEQNFRYRTVELTIPLRNAMTICASNC